MPTKTSVSVVIPTFNRTRYLRIALSSIFGQTITPSQVIVVDDGSTEDASAVMSEFPGIQYLKKPNGGKPSALNYALPHVTGKYLWFFDDDDIALPHSIETHIEVLEKQPDLSFVCSEWWRGQDPGTGEVVFKTRSALPLVSEHSLFAQLLQGCFVLLQGTLVRTDCIRALGKFREDLFRIEDYDMLLRLARAYRGTLLHVPTFILRIHDAARGPSYLSFANHQRDNVATELELILFRELYSSVRLEEYDPEDLRRAIVGRVRVMAVHGVWDKVIADLATLNQDRFNDLALSPRERELCRNAMQGGYYAAFDSLIEDPNLAKAIRRISTSTVTKEMKMVFVLAIYYEAHRCWRAGERRRARRMAQLIWRLSGINEVKTLVARPYRQMSGHEG